MKIHYPYIMAQFSDGKYYVSFLDFEEANTKGETFEEALLKAEEMLTLALESRLQKGGGRFPCRHALLIHEQDLYPLQCAYSRLFWLNSAEENKL